MFPYYISRSSAEELENEFGKRLQDNDTSDYCTFQVWGIGGVGKTTLTEKLRDDYQNKADFTWVSFGRTPDINHSIKLMNVLYKELPSLKLSPLQKDSFKELYQKYWDTINELKNTPIEGKKEVDKEQVNLVENLISEGASALIKFTPASAIPDTVVKETTKKVFEVGGLMLSAKDRIGQFLQQHKATKNQRELKELMLDPIPKLTEAFITSLKQRKRPVVLVFDTYEKSTIDIDGWLWQYLIGNRELKKSKICILIAGRKNILKNEPWRKLQQDTQLIYDRALDRFDESQTKDYLERINITDADQVDNIFKITKGLPYYLDKIRERRERGEDIDFSQLNQDIVNLLLQGLTKTQQQVIELAACCRWFDKQLIQDLMSQQEGLDFKTAVDEQLNCFEWLKERDFVEYIQGKYRLDDVARDVFRQEFWLEEPQQFKQVHQQLASYFQEQSNKEVFPDSSPAQQYNNSTWRNHITDFLYHRLYGGQQNSQIDFISHLFAARYFNQDEIVQLVLGEIVSEVNLNSDQETMLSIQMRQFLREISPAVSLGYSILQEFPLNYEYFEQYNLSKTDIEQTIKQCFRYVDKLEGMANFTALLYKSKRCYPSQRLNYLQQAKQQAEVIATESDPEFSSGLFLSGLEREFSEMGEYETAINCCNTAIKFKPDFHEAWNNRGAILEILVRYEEAITSYDKALKFKPDLHEAWYNRGISLENLEGYEEAIASYDKALECKSYFHEAWYNRGISLANLGRYEEAIASYDKALEFKPDKHQAWYNRGVTLGILGRYEEEIDSYDKALKIKPDDYEAWLYRGVTLGNLGRYEEAIDSYDKALEIKPDYDNAWYNKACYYALQNNLTLAIENLQQAIYLNPDWKDMAKTDTDFDNIREDEQFKALLNSLNSPEAE